MSRNIGFFATDEETLELEAYANSIGLLILPRRLNMILSKDLAVEPGCWLSMVPPKELKPYGDPPVRLTAGDDPLLDYRRPFYKDNHLVLGNIKWDTVNREMAAQTKDSFQKMARWIRAHYEKQVDFYFSPGAVQKMAEGAEVVNFFPWHKFEEGYSG
jgi:hypothetical protein